MPKNASGAVEDSVSVRVGANLRRLRHARGMSQPTYARCVGVTYQQVQKYESGANRMSAVALWRACTVLKVEPNDLFEGLDALDGAEPSGHQRSPAKGRL